MKTHKKSGIPESKDVVRVVPAGNEERLDAGEAGLLLDLFRSGQQDLLRAVAFFAAHPTLEAEVLKRSNSVFHSRGERTAELESAILRLGHFELYDIVFKALARHRNQRTRL